MSINVDQWDIFELSLHHNEAGNPYQDVQMEATFTHQGRSVRVDGFYDGDGGFKIRCMPDQPGEWRFVTRSNVPALDGQVVVAAGGGYLPILFRHAPAALEKIQPAGRSVPNRCD